MAPSFTEIINSRLFKFIVGETIDGSLIEFLVYEEAIAQLSKPLHTLINDLSEAQAGCTIWKEVSKETFERFVQFAYIGDYLTLDTRECIKAAEPQKEDIDVLKAFESRLAEEKSTEGYDSVDELQSRGLKGKKTKKDKKKSKGPWERL